MNTNFTSCFLTSSMPVTDAGASKEIPPDESELSLPAILITFWFQFLPFSCFDKDDLFNLKLEISRRPPLCQPPRLTLMNFMMNNRPLKQAYPDQTRRLSSTPLRSQAMIPEKRYQYHQLHRLNHRL